MKNKIEEFMSNKMEDNDNLSSIYFERIRSKTCKDFVLYTRIYIILNFHL